MRVSKERQLTYISQIRRALAMNPYLSLRELQEALLNKEYPLKLGIHYINKLVKKIHKEQAERMNYYTLNKTLAIFQDEINELKKRLWIIIISPLSSDQSKISAIRELRISSIILFDKMFESGIFEKKLGEISTKDQKIINEIDKLPKDERIKYFKKLAQAKNIIIEYERKLR